MKRYQESVNCDLEVVVLALRLMERADEGTFILQAHDTIRLDLN